MSNNLGSLVVSLGLEASEFTRGLSKSEYETQRTTQRISASLLEFSKYLAGLQLGSVFVQSIRSATDYADEIGKLSQKAGVGAEALSRLTYAAGLSDVSNEQLAKGLRELTTDAEGGGKKLAAFGVSLTDASGKSRTADQLLASVADRFASMPDGIEKTAAAAALFGDRIGPELIPLLNAGSQGLKTMGEEAQRAGLVIGDDAAKAAEKFNDNLTRLDGTIKGLSITVAGPIVSGINGLIDRFNEGSKAGQGFIETLLKQTETARLLGLAETRNPYTEARKELERVEKALASGTLNAMRTTSLMQKQAELSKVIASTLTGKRLDNADPRIIRGPGAYGELFENPPAKPPRTGGTPATSTKDRDYFRMLDEYARAEDDNRMRVVRRQMEDEERDQRALIELRRQSAVEEFNALDTRNRKYQEWLQAVTEAAPSQQLERQRQAMIDLAAEYERGTFGIVGSEEAIARWGETVGSYLGTLQVGVKEINSTADQSGQIFGNWLEEAISDGAKLSDVINGLIRDLAQLAIRKAIIEPAAGAFSGFVGGLFSGASSFEGGGFTGFGARSGGLDGQGGFMAMLHPNETVIDHTRGQGMGGVTVMQTFHFGNADAATVGQLRAEAQRIKAETLAAVPGVVMNSAARGGSFARSVGR